MDIASGTVNVKGSGMIVMRDVTISKEKAFGDLAITKLQDWLKDDILARYCYLPNIIDVTKAIIGPNVRAMHSMLINKPPDTGFGSSRHPPHQDLWYFPFRPVNRITCAWSALQKIDPSVGGLFVLPGSHRQSLLLHVYPKDGIVNKAYFGIQDLAEEKHGNQ